MGSANSGDHDIEEMEDFEILEGDVQRSVANDTPSIEFSNKINQILIKDMENTIILKLLGRNIGFMALQNKIYSLWKPSYPFHLTDIENGYYLAKIHNRLDYEKVFRKVHGLSSDNI